MEQPFQLKQQARARFWFRLRQSCLWLSVLCLAFKGWGALLSQPVPATPIASISSFDAFVHSAGTLLRWQSASEIGLLSFDLFRSAGATDWRKVNAEIIPAANSPGGFSYEALDVDAFGPAERIYKLVGVDQHNREWTLGIFSVSATQPPPAAARSGVPASFAPAPKSKGAPIASFAPTDPSTILKINTTNTGMQKLPAAAIASALGRELGTVQESILERQFRLTHLGEEVGYVPAVDGSALLFFAEAHKDNYGDRNVFLLVPGNAASLEAANGLAPLATANPSGYLAQIEHERDLLTVTTLPMDPEDDFWMWTRLVAGLSGFDTVNYPLPVNGLVTNGTSQLSLQLWGGNAIAHRIQVNVNGQTVTTADWSFMTPFTLNVTIPSLVLTNGTNTLTVKALINGSPSPRSQWYVNKFSHQYPRLFLAQSGQLEFTASNADPVTIDGFTNGAITVLDVSNIRAPLVVTNLHVEPTSTNFRVSFVPALARRYVAFQAGAGAAVDKVAVAAMDNLSSPTNAAEYVIVVPDSLIAAANILAAHRQATGLSTRIARMETIYNEFAHGFPNANAIRAFLASARANWLAAPRYAVLLGDGTYDYRNLLARGDNLTPPLMVNTPYGLFASDSAQGDLDGDGVPDLAIGRISGDTVAELTDVINKIKAYDFGTAPGVSRSLLVADLPDAAGDFNDNMAVLDGVLSNKFTATFIRRTEQASTATMTAAITNAWNQGVELVNYAGHGALDRFGSSGYLTSVNSTNLVGSQLPVVIAITCVAGQFSVPGTDCLGEYLVRKKNGGAIAVVAPTGLSWNSEAMALNVRLARLLKENTEPALGDIFRAAIAGHIVEDAPVIPGTIYNLLGDPATVYKTERHFLPPVATTLPAQNVKSTMATLEAAVVANLPAAVHFEYGLSTNYGLLTGTSWMAGTNVSSVLAGIVPDLAPSTSYHFRVVASNKLGVVRGADMTFVTAEGTAPTLVLKFPGGGQRITNDAPVVATGTAKDLGSGVTGIWFRLNGGPFALAAGTTNWTATLTPVPGLNVIEVKAVDGGGNESLLVRREFYQVIFSRLTLLTSGLGAITSQTTAMGTPTNNAVLEVGRAYRVTAVPGPAHVLSNWSGTLSHTNVASLTFIMGKDLILVANFITSPFTATAGQYNGLFHQDDEMSHHSSGFLALILNGRAGFSARLLLDGDTVAFSGKFEVNGTWHRPISRAKLGKPDLRIDLALDLAEKSDRLTGTIAEGTNWVAPLLADRKVWSITNVPTQWTNYFTMLLPALALEGEAPPGFGYAAVTVTSRGTVQSAGRLPEGSSLIRTVPFSRNGDWPFYLPLHRTIRIYTNLLKTTNLLQPVLQTNSAYYRGSLFGWLSFSNAAPSETLSWIKTGVPGTLYPAGFTNVSAVMASLYTPSTTELPAPHLANGSLTLGGGDLSSAIERDVAGQGSRLVLTPADPPVKLTLNPKSGAVTGTFRHPAATNAPTTLRGMVLQQQKLTGGYFLGTNGGGKLLIEQTAE